MPIVFSINTGMTMYRSNEDNRMYVKKSKKKKMGTLYIKIGIKLTEKIVEEMYYSQPGFETIGLFEKISVISQNEKMSVIIPFTSDKDQIMKKLKNWSPNFELKSVNGIIDQIKNSIGYGILHYGVISPISIIIITDKIKLNEIKIIKRMIEEENDIFENKENKISKNIFLTLIGLELIVESDKDYEEYIEIKNKMKDRINIVINKEKKTIEEIKNQLKLMKFFESEKIQILCGNLKSSTCYMYPKLNHIKSKNDIKNKIIN